MNHAGYQRIKHIYYEVSERPEAQRESYLDDVCREEPEVREQVRKLLHAPDTAQAFMEQPAIDSEALRRVALTSLAEAEAAEPLPERIGRYRVIRLLGEGGMGSVYEAQQDTPQRRVALKVLRSSVGLPRLLQRFQQEVEVLGRLQHPGIARIYDAGVADVPRRDGRSQRLPYFAMELIDGQPITAYAQAQSLGVPGRLSLLARACEAVHYGHEHGVIHRDLKPANILVRDDSADGPAAPAPVAKIIDFGVARVTGADLALTTMHTDAGQIVGTLAYMSPEQVRGDARDIDERSDVYALGVVGYELLTGRLPYDVSGKVAPEAARIIRDEEPSRMSSISRVFRGDIETIFAKALEKEPARRYPTAAALATDIRRYLSDEPIVARPPTLRYQLGKFARRHKEFVAGLVLTFIVLVAGIIGTTIALVRAVAQENAASAAKTAADVAAGQARAHAATAQHINEVMQKILSYAQPGVPGGGHDVKVVDMLDRASEDLLSQLADAPEIELAARHTLGRTYLQLGRHDSARRDLHRAAELAAQLHGVDSAEALDIAADVSQLRVDAGEAESRAHTVQNLDYVMQRLAVARRVLGPSHRTTQRLLFCAARLNLAAYQAGDAGRCLDELIVATADLHPEQRAFTGTAVSALLAHTLWAQFRFEEAEQLARTVMASEHDRMEILRETNVPIEALLAAILDNTDRGDEAAEHFRRALDEQIAALGESHEATLWLADQYAGLCTRLGRAEEALAIWEMVRTARQLRQYDLNYVPYLHAYQASLLDDLGRINESREHFQQAIAQRRATHGDKDYLAQEWWRAMVMRAGGLYQHWPGEALRAHAMHNIQFTLRPQPTHDFKADEIDWVRGSFTLSRWTGTEREHVAAGSWDHLRNLPDPEPGLYKLSLRVPWPGRDVIAAGGWLLITPWELDKFRAYRGPNPAAWTEPVLAGAHEHVVEPALVLSSFHAPACFGPRGATGSFGITGHTTIQLPAGRYRFHAVHDDGLRLWLDDTLVIDRFVKDGGRGEFDIELDGQPHDLRVEYFQHGQHAVLWLWAEPIAALEP